MNRIGTCSNCGGPVIVSDDAVHPVPHCASCGAIPKTPYVPPLPVIPMEVPVPTVQDPKPHAVIYRGFC